MHVAVVRSGALTTAELAAISRGALDRPLAHDAELLVAVPADAAVVHGAFDRGALRRGSGGAPVRASPGTVWVQLSLRDPGCEPRSILNRHVRPLLRAVHGAYFGRDWVSGHGDRPDRGPVAVVGYAHDAATGRTLVEAFVAATERVDVGPRASFRGQEPRTLGRDAAVVSTVIIDVFAPSAVVTTVAHGGGVGGADTVAAAVGGAAEPPWAATVEEAIGTVAAGRDHRGRMRVGGELMASRDAVGRLEDALAAMETVEAVAGFDAGRGDAVERAVDDALGAPEIALFGVRALQSIADVIRSAYRAPAAPGRITL